MYGSGMYGGGMYGGGGGYDDSFGSAVKRGFYGMPVAVRTIIVINLGVFLLQMLGGTSFNEFLRNTFAFLPEWQTALTQPWRLVTYMFLHGGLWHVAWNMLILWFLGRAVEAHLGPRNFLVLYFGAGVGGALINVVFTALLPDVFPSHYTVGASGGVIGIMVCFAVMFPRAQILLLFIPIEARFLVAGFIAIDFLFITSAGDNVARIVHLGGALCGYLLLKLYQQGFHYDLWLENLGRKRKAKGGRQTAGGKAGGKGARHMEPVTEAEVLEEEDQSELDRILDKISKEGYEGLTKEEKRLLFELSKRDHR